MMTGMGALVTLELAEDSPARDLPWIVTFGPLGDDEEWEPVVCGPYERPHALALAESVVADEELMAVVEPLLPLADAEAIRDEIELARAVEAGDGPDQEEPDWEQEHVRPGPAPSAGEVKAGFARIAARLTSGLTSG